MNNPYLDKSEYMESKIKRIAEMSCTEDVELVSNIMAASFEVYLQEFEEALGLVEKNDMDELIHEWATDQGFETWFRDHETVVNNLGRWLSKRVS